VSDLGTAATTIDEERPEVVAQARQRSRRGISLEVAGLYVLCIGGALGIAVFGSIVSSLYRSNLDFGGVDVPATAAAEAEESLGAAVGAAAQVGGAEGASLVERAADAFTDAFSMTAVISAVIVVVAAYLVSRTFTTAKELEAELAGPLTGPSEPEVLGSGVSAAAAAAD